MTDQESLDHWLSLWWPESSCPLPSANAVITDIQEPEDTFNDLERETRPDKIMTYKP